MAQSKKRILQIFALVPLLTSSLMTLQNGDPKNLLSNDNEPKNEPPNPLSDEQGTELADGYTKYEQKYLLRFHNCTRDIAASTQSSVSNKSCICLGDFGELLEPLKGCCTTEPVVCDAMVGSRFLDLYNENVSLISNDTGRYYRELSGRQESYIMPNISLPTLFEPTDFYSKWRDLDSEEKRVQRLVKKAKGIATREQIGASFQNHPIYSVRFTGPGYKKGGTKILLTFQLHAREWVAGMAGVYVTEQMVKKIMQEETWLKDMEVVVVPMCNPDGFLYSGKSDRMWRKNMHDYDGNNSMMNSMGSCRGVDLNRNFPTDWNGGSSVSLDHCSDIYVGTGAASEPETQAIKNLVDETNLTLHMDFHSYSEIFLAPWSYKKEPHPDRERINALMHTLADTVQHNSGKMYSTGGSELLYQASGVAPDYSTSTGAWGITMELSPKMDFSGGGFMLPEKDIYPTAQDAWQTVVAAIDFIKEEKGLK